MTGRRGLGNWHILQPFPLELSVEGLCPCSLAYDSVGMKLSLVFHSSIYLHILFYIMKNHSLLCYWKMSAGSPVLWHVLWKIFPKAKLIVPPWNGTSLYHNAFHIDLQIFIYVHVCSQAKVSAPYSGDYFLFISVFPPPSIMPFIVGLLWKDDWYFEALVQSFWTIIYLQ